MLEQIDIALFQAINRFAGNSYWLDQVVRTALQNDMVKGMPVFLVWWGLWFSGARSEKTRAGLMAVLLLSIVAIFVGRGLALLLPMRLRPIHDPEVAVNIPFGVSETWFDGWSSMPSDHAVLFFALAVGIFFVHRIAGTLLLLHAALVVSLSRVYTGVHYPGDVLVGAIVGGAMAALLFHRIAAKFVDLNLGEIERQHGAILYPVLFFVTFQAASMFVSSRELLDFGVRIAASLFAPLLN